MLLLMLQLATLVGCSMGAAVIWAHLELFGDARIGKCVFVDQAPLQVCHLWRHCVGAKKMASWTVLLLASGRSTEPCLRDEPRGCQSTFLWVRLQDRAEDWSLGSRGCYDAVSLTRLQMQLRYDFQGVAQVAADGLCLTCYYAQHIHDHSCKCSCLH